MPNRKRNAKKERDVSFHEHHMIPKHAKYWSDLAHLKEDPLFKVKLTIEGHACQHDILHRVWGDKFDHIASQTLLGQMTKSEAAAAAEREGSKKGAKIVGDRLGPERVKSGRWAEIQELAYQKTRRPCTLIVDGEERHFEGICAAARKLGVPTSVIYKMIRNAGHSTPTRACLS